MGAIDCRLSGLRNSSGIRFGNRKEFLSLLAPGAVGAEVGVLRGDFSAELLKHTKVQRLLLIDCWEKQPDDVYRDVANAKQEHQVIRYEFVKRRFAAEVQSGRVEVWRMLFDEAAQKIEDGSLDWAYLDANHSYTATREALHLYGPKVRPGGVLGGHDYILRETFGVVQAVNEFAENGEWELFFVSTCTYSRFALRRKWPKLKVFSFWRNPPRVKTRPGYLDLCQASVNRHCGAECEVVELDENTVKEYLPDLRPEALQMPCIAHQADYIRAQLVYQHGGVWLDRDMISLQSLNGCLEVMQSSLTDFIACGRPGKRPSNGFFGGLRGNELLREYIRAMDLLIDSRPALDFGWTDLSYALLWPIAARCRFFQYDFRVCIPVHPARFRAFFACKCWKDHPDCDIRHDTLMVYLYNAMFPSEFKRLTAAEVLAGENLIADLFKLALRGRCNHGKTLADV